MESIQAIVDIVEVSHKWRHGRMVGKTGGEGGKAVEDFKGKDKKCGLDLGKQWKPREGCMKWHPVF